MAWVTRTNLKGPTGTIDSATASVLAPGATPTITLGGTPAARSMAFGIPQGPVGPQGLDGVNAVENDAAVAGYISTTGTSETKTALSAVVVELAGRNTSQIARDVAVKLIGKKVAVILRHDDVQASALDYLPLYASRGIQASWYVNSAGVGTINAGAQMATAVQLLDIAADGHELGAHGTAWLPWTDLTTESARRAALLESKEYVETLLGGGYLCETFAYPGNASGGGGWREVLDYFIMGTTGVSVGTTAGNENTAGQIDMAEFQAQYPTVLIDADPALTPAKAQAWFDGQKSRDGVTIFTLQAHNTSEVSVANMTALVDTIQADPQVTTLTMRELGHYLLHNLQPSQSGKYRYARNANVGADVLEFNSPSVASSGYAVDRLGLGKAFRAFVSGVEASSLDASLRVAGSVPGAISTFEMGHPVAWYSPNMLKSVAAKMLDSAVFQLVLSGTGASFQVYNGSLKVQNDGWAVEVATLSGATKFRVDSTRETAWLAVLTAIPTGASMAGEFANVNGTLMICTAAGSPGTWVSVGSQS